MKQLYSTTIASRYAKALQRFHNNIRSGRFALYTTQKRGQIWKRLCRYARQLDTPVKVPLAAASLLAALAVGYKTSAQTFVERTGAANPLVISGYVGLAPSFVDIDNDGDKDAFVGENSGTILYYKNTGTSNSPIFTLQTGAANPLNVDVGTVSAPTFVDIDNDGDKDAFIGTTNAGIVFYRNTGTPSAPVFTAVTGASNPLNGVATLRTRVKAAFVDIDKDGDMDVFVDSSYYGTLLSYYKNTGTATSPVFTVQTGAANPLNGVAKTINDSPTFVDIDTDGDQDCFIGGSTGSMYYYKNTGTLTSPVFAEQTGVNNPLAGFSGSSYLAPTFTDINNDGDQDLFVGTNINSIRLMANTTFSLPLKLVSFTGKQAATGNQLSWKTADEVNTQAFQVERSSDGVNFFSIAVVRTAGPAAGNYAVTDQQAPAGKVYYRLKMVDIDGSFTYSLVIQLETTWTAQIGLSPNPVVSMLTVSGSSKLQDTEAGIYNAGGQLLQRFRITGSTQQVPVGALPKGWFLLRFADGSTEKFIKK